MSAFTSIGRYGERVTLQQETRAPDASGGYVVGWADVVTLWAAVTPLSANERLDAGQLAGRVGYRFSVRCASPPADAQRLLWRSAQLNIRGITRTGSGTFEITAEDGAPT